MRLAFALIWAGSVTTAYSGEYQRKLFPIPLT